MRQDPGKDVNQKDGERKPRSVAPQNGEERFWTQISSLAWSLIVLALILFLLLAVFAGMQARFFFDLRITHAVQSIDNPIFNFLMRAVSWPGATPQVIAVILVIVLAIYGAGSHWEAIASAVSAVLSQMLNYLTKIIVQRPRPMGELVEVLRELPDFSYPSGHVTLYTAFLGFLSYLVYTRFPSSWLRNLLLSFLVALILLVGPSRIYLGVHWFSDVVGGYLLGGISMVISIAIYHWGKGRFFMQEMITAPEERRVD